MHEPDKNGKSSAMLATDEVMQARARHMVSTDDNQTIHYRGDAVAWQGANRVEADRLDIDRDAGIMEAHGKVKSQFVDKDKSKDDDGEAPAAPAAAPVFTIVTAPHMVYTEETRVVEYTGGVMLRRPEMTVSAQAHPRVSEGRRRRFVARQSLRGWNGEGGEHVRQAEADAHGHLRARRVLRGRWKSDPDRRLSRCWWIA